MIRRVVRRHRGSWGVLSEDGTVYSVVLWKHGRRMHDGALWLAVRNWWLLRRHEPRARVVRVPKKVFGF